jgi:hypothetical protein
MTSRKEYPDDALASTAALSGREFSRARIAPAGCRIARFG